MPREFGAMGTGCTAIGIERERAGVVAAFDGHLSDQVGHPRIDDLKDAGGGFRQVEAERLCDAVGNRALG